MSGSIFHIGEIAVIHAPGSIYHDVEVTVIEGLHWLDPVNAWGVVDGPAFQGYTIESSAIPAYPHRVGRGWAIRPENLRKGRPPSDPAYLKFRDQFVREFAMDAEPPVLQPRHPSIVAMLELIGQESVSWR